MNTQACEVAIGWVGARIAITKPVASAADQLGAIVVPAAAAPSGGRVR